MDEALLSARRLPILECSTSRREARPARGDGHHEGRTCQGVSRWLRYGSRTTWRSCQRSVDLHFATAR